MGFAWANAVIAAHPTLPAIVTTHELAYADDGGQAYLSLYEAWGYTVFNGQQPTPDSPRLTAMIRPRTFADHQLA